MRESLSRVTNASIFVCVFTNIGTKSEHPLRNQFLKGPYLFCSCGLSSACFTATLHPPRPTPPTKNPHPHSQQAHPTTPSPYPMHRTAAVAAAYPPHDVVPDTKGRLPPKAGALGSDAQADAAARFFASDRFATLCAHAYDLGALQQPSAYEADGGAGDGGTVEAVLGLPTLRQLVLDAARAWAPPRAGCGRGRPATARGRVGGARRPGGADASGAHAEEWLEQQTALARVAGPPTATRLAVQMVTAVSRDFVARPHRWALSGVAVLFATTGAQAVFVETLGNHLVPIFGQFYASDVDTVNRLSADLATALARQLITLPGTVWSALGDKRLSPARAAGRIAVRVALPLTTNLILLTPASMLVPAGAGVVGVTALLALTPLGEAVLGETLATRAGQAGATLTLTGATALAARLALQAIPGVSFAAGTSISRSPRSSRRRSHGRCSRR